MHENGGTQQYYIATKSSPTDDRARVLKYGRLFSVFDHLGDIQTSGLGEQGLFFQGTRHLSELLLRLWGARPLPLSSTIETNNFLFTADLTNLDKVRGLGAPVASIGGAGTFDGIFLTGILAVLLANLFPHPPQQQMQPG